MIQHTTMPQPMRLRFTVDDYYKMIELGMLKDYEKAEIIEGELITKTMIKNKPALCVERLNKTLSNNLSKSLSFQRQKSIKIDDYNELQPDFAILKKGDNFDPKVTSNPKDILVAIEVSDSTLKYDRTIKRRLYAEAEIPEVWIVNLKNNIIEVHQKPDIGIYQLAQIYKRGETVKSSVLPSLEIEVNKILA
jgi:Uma2 family endonuclease